MQARKFVVSQLDLEDRDLEESALLIEREISRVAEYHSSVYYCSVVAVSITPFTTRLVSQGVLITLTLLPSSVAAAGESPGGECHPAQSPVLSTK